MKTLTLIALATLFAAPAFADPKTVFGCEIVDMGGYSNKADPTCAFDVITGSGAEIDPEALAELLEG